jgi:hypothetical protein
VGYYKKFAGTLHHIAMPAHRLLVDGHLGTSKNGLLMGLAFISLLARVRQRRLVAHRTRSNLQWRREFSRPESPNARKTLVTMSCIWPSCS